MYEVLKVAASQENVKVAFSINCRNKFQNKQIHAFRISSIYLFERVSNTPSP
jgi:hypothetical protein